MFYFMSPGSMRNIWENRFDFDLIDDDYIQDLDISKITSEHSKNRLRPDTHRKTTLIDIITKSSVSNTTTNSATTPEYVEVTEHSTNRPSSATNWKTTIMDIITESSVSNTTNSATTPEPSNIIPSTYNTSRGYLSETNGNYTSTSIFIVQTLAAIISLIALIYGIVTWITLRKARTFQNYVYISGILALTIVLCLSNRIYFKPIDIRTAKTAKETDIKFYVDCFMLFFEFGFLCWLAVASALMYRDIVIVFTTHIRRKMLKCNLFAWGVPVVLISAVLCTSIDEFAVWYAAILSFVLVVQVGIYVRVLYSLFADTDPAGSNRCRKVQVATVTFFMGGIPVVLQIAITQKPISMVIDGFLALDLVVVILLQVPTIVFNVLFVMGKANRRLWRERRLNIKQVRAQMDCEH